MGAPRTRQVADQLMLFVGERCPTTLQVERHFGWTRQRARRELEELADQGLVSASWERQRSGAMNRWRIELGREP